MFEWADDLKLAGCDLFLDSRQSRRRCFVSHAHSDHLGLHQQAIATGATAALAEYRIGATGVTELAYRQPYDLDERTRLTLLPAGHVFGSAMLHAQTPDGSLLYTGDFKLRECKTIERAEPRPADVLVTECTFGRPFFKFPPRQQIVDQLTELVAGALRDGRQPIVLAYSLGKSQEATRILTDAGFNVTQHGAVFAMSRIHERLGVRLGRFRRYHAEHFHGAEAIDLKERGVLVAPPQAARTGFVNRFKNPCRIVLTGWAMMKNAAFRYGVDHALPLSDHADFAELLELVERVNPKKIYTHHGYAEFADELKSRGYNATLAKPSAQMTLFD